MCALRTFSFAGLIILHIIMRADSTGHLQVGFFLYELRHGLDSSFLSPDLAAKLSERQSPEAPPASVVTSSDDVITDDDEDDAGAASTSTAVVPWKLRSLVPSSEDQGEKEEEESLPTANKSTDGVLPWKHAAACNNITATTWVRYRFLLCLDYVGSESSPKRCRLAHLEFQSLFHLGALERDLVTFPSTVDLTPKGILSSNPLIFEYDRWKGPVRLSVYVACCGAEGGSEERCNEILSYVIQQTPAPFALKMSPENVVLKGRGSLTLFMLLQCDEGYYGPGCDVQCHVEYPSVEHMFCNVTSGHRECLPGWEGPECQIDTDECRFSYCHNDAHCVNSPPGSFTCLCQLGTSGRLCEKRRQVCHKKPCQNGGTCEDTSFGFLCFCSPGFSGDLCEQVDALDSNSTESSPVNTTDVAIKVAQEHTHHNRTSTREAKYLIVWEPWYTAIIVSVFLILVIGIGCVVKGRLTRRNNINAKSSFYRGILEDKTFDNSAFDDFDDYDEFDENSIDYENTLQQQQPPSRPPSRRAKNVSGVQRALRNKETATTSTSSVAAGRNRTGCSIIHTLGRRPGLRQGPRRHHAKFPPEPRPCRGQRRWRTEDAEKGEEEEKESEEAAQGVVVAAADPGFFSSSSYVPFGGDYEGLPNLVNPRKSPFLAHRCPSHLPSPVPRRSGTPSPSAVVVALVAPTPARPAKPVAEQRRLRVPALITGGAGTAADSNYLGSSGESASSSPPPLPGNKSPGSLPAQARGSSSCNLPVSSSRLGSTGSSSRESTWSSLNSFSSFSRSSSSSSSSTTKALSIFRRPGKVFTMEETVSADGRSDDSGSSISCPSPSPKPRGSLLLGAFGRRGTTATSTEPRLCSIRRVDSIGYEVPSGGQRRYNKPGSSLLSLLSRKEEEEEEDDDDDAHPYNVPSHSPGDEHVYEKIYPDGSKGDGVVDDAPGRSLNDELPLDPSALPQLPTSATTRTSTSTSNYNSNSSSPELPSAIPAYTMAAGRRCSSVGDDSSHSYVDLDDELETSEEDDDDEEASSAPIYEKARGMQKTGEDEDSLRGSLGERNGDLRYGSVVRTDRSSYESARRAREEAGSPTDDRPGETMQSSGAAALGLCSEAQTKNIASDSDS